MAYEAFAENGWDIHYLSIEKFPVSREHIHFHRIPMLFKKKENLLFWLNFFLVAFPWLVYFSLRLSADVIFVFGEVYAFLSFPAKLLRGNKIVLMTRGESIESLKETHAGIRGSLLRLVYHAVSFLAFKVSDGLIFNSPSLSQKMKQKYRLQRKKIIVLPNDIPVPVVRPRAEALTKIRQEYPIGENPFILISVGRLHPGKNYEFLLKVFEKLKASLKGDDIFLFIAGDDPLTGEKERARLRSLIELRGLDHVFLTGWRDDLYFFYSAADVFITSSKYEGAPNSLLEALGYGLPCFGSDVGGIRDILNNDLLVFSLDEAGAEKAADLIDKMHHDIMFVSRVKSICLEVRRRFTFDWKRELVTRVESC
jgi:glycosyltransferase involved in cell wall biosynthesis